MFINGGLFILENNLDNKINIKYFNNSENDNDNYEEINVQLDRGMDFASNYDKKLIVNIDSSLNKILESVLRNNGIISNVIEFDENKKINYKSDNVKIYLDQNMQQIKNNLKELSPSLLKMIVIVNEKDVSYFEIVQFKKDDNLKLVGCNINPEIWRISEEFEKNKSKTLKKDLF